MIKFFICSLIMICNSICFAADKPLEIPASVSSVISKDGPYEAKYSNAVRYRMSVKNSLGGEGSQNLVFEKFAPGKYGSPDQTIFSKEIAVTDLPTVKEFVADIAKKSVEATYGCCGVEDAKWDDYKIKFKVRREKKSFACETTEFAEGKFKVICKN